MTELSLEKALTTFGWVFSQIGKFYTFWAFLSRFPGGWGACLLVDLLVWSSVVLCFAVLAGDWQPADRKRPRVASDHIVIARIHGELLRLHILGTPPSWIRILLSVISSLGGFYTSSFSLCQYLLLLQNSGCFCDVRVPLGGVPPSAVLVRCPFCEHTMGFIGIDMHRCLPAPNHISIYNFAIASCQSAVCSSTILSNTTLQ